MKSQCHTGLEVAPVQLFTCKHPLTELLPVVTPLCEELTSTAVTAHFVVDKTKFSAL